MEEASVKEPLLGTAKDKGEEEKAKEKLTRMQMAANAFRYAMPRSAPLLVRLMLCFVLVGLECVVHLSYPILFKHMTNRFAEVSSGVQAEAAAAAAAAATKDGQPPPGAVLQAACRQLLAGSGPLSLWSVVFPWGVAWLGVYFLQGGSGTEGVLSDVRDLLWIPITQAAYRSVSLDVFAHLMELDHDFHLHRKTGQIMRIFDRGTSSVQDTVEIVLFNVVPRMLDIALACTYLTAFMDPWIALIVFITVASYVPLTIAITERRGAIRKTMNALDNEREARATDMLLNYETVKYFCNEWFELKRYDEATKRYQSAEYWQLAFLAFLSLVQTTVVWVGLCAGLLVCVARLCAGRLSSGDILLFITMMQNLYVPLTYFGSYYRQVQKALIDMENLLELLARRPKVRDGGGAPPLLVTQGQVDFERVDFAYNANPVLHEVSFSVEGGSALAVVGATGSGKSTILRLLLRFYDPQGGRVCIDGQDLRCVSQLSVRGAIAVVPQDPVLFNDTLLYNIAYGRPGVSEAEVVEAAKAAHIHDTIVSFSKGYNTRVGERGLRLSGGEKQRVAFARAVLKRPRLLILDEATSALDSLTEQLIQCSLAAMRHTCTTLIVAHRLSTIMDADAILVLDHGHVIESGSHWELLDRGGHYAAMWARQNDLAADLRSSAITRSSSLGALQTSLSGQCLGPMGGGDKESPQHGSRGCSPDSQRPYGCGPPHPKHAAGESGCRSLGPQGCHSNGSHGLNDFHMGHSGHLGLPRTRSFQTMSEETDSVQDSEAVSTATEEIQHDMGNGGCGPQQHGHCTGHSHSHGHHHYHHHAASNGSTHPQPHPPRLPGISAGGSPPSRMAPADHGSHG